MDVSFASRAGSGAVPNEDAVAASDRAVVVVDGVTAPAGLPTGCVHGTAWFARVLAAECLAVVSGDPDVELRQALARALSTVAERHGGGGGGGSGGCDLSAEGTPCATVAILRETDGRLDYLVLSDATVVVKTIDGLCVVTDDRGAMLLPDLHAAVTSAPVGSAERARLLAELVSQQRKLRNVAGGYWLAGAVPEAAGHALVGSLPREEVRHAAALTDGASRLVDLFAATDWSTAAQWLADESPGAWIERVRRIEAGDPGAVRWPRHKTSDDATIAYVRYDG